MKTKVSGLRDWTPKHLRIQLSNTCISRVVHLLDSFVSCWLDCDQKSKLKFAFCLVLQIA